MSHPIDSVDKCVSRYVGFRSIVRRLLVQSIHINSYSNHCDCYTWKSSAGGRNHLIFSVKFKQFLHILDHFAMPRYVFCAPHRTDKKSPNFLGEIQSFFPRFWTFLVFRLCRWCSFDSGLSYAVMNGVTSVRRSGSNIMRSEVRLTDRRTRTEHKQR